MAVRLLYQAYSPNLSIVMKESKRAVGTAEIKSLVG